MSRERMSWGDDEYGFYAVIESIRETLPNWIDYTPPPFRAQRRYWLYIGPRRTPDTPGQWEIGYQSQDGLELIHPATGEDFAQMVGFLVDALRESRFLLSWHADDADDG